MANITRKVAYISKKRKLSNAAGERRQGQEWRSCMEGFDGFCTQPAAVEVPQTQVKIEWTSDQEDNSSDSPPNTLEDPPCIEVEESPVKVHQPLTADRAQVKCHSRASWSPHIDFPDHMDSPKAAKKAHCPKSKRKLPLPDDTLSDGTSSQSQDILEYEESAEQSAGEEDDDAAALSSPPISSTDSPTPARSTATQWAHGLHTPQKHQHHQYKHESAKKKNKFEKDSLAERMQKLMSRERVSYTMWKHSARKLQQSERGRCVTVEVQSIVRTFSHVCADCRVLPGTCVEELGDTVRLLLLAHLIPHTLTVGNTLTIHPPWQKLLVEGSTVCMLCTQHCQVVAGSKHAGGGGGRWSCPCSKDCSLPPAQCPHYAHPHAAHPSQAEQEEEEAGSPHPTPLPAPSSHSNILPAIEGQGHCAVSFTATLLRVFCKKVPVKSMRQAVRSAGDSGSTQSGGESPDGIPQLSLLLQDSSNTMCLLHVPHCQPWNGFTASCEGHSYEWSGLRVTQRMSKARSPALFSMLEALHNSQVAASFCYIVSAVAGESRCERVSVCQVQQPLVVSSLADLSGSRRCSVEAKVYYAENAAAGRTDVSHVYIIDASVCVGAGATVRKVTLCPAAYVAAAVREQLHTGHTLIFRDLWLKHGELYFDEFSQVSASAEQQQYMYQPPALDSHSHATGCIVTLQGEICDVDESTAFSWRACDRCNNDKLVGGTASNPFLFCRACSAAVLSPVHRMHLDVYVTTPNNTRAKLTLLQKTIEAILPGQSEDQEEGYEMSSVLAQNVGPLACIVTGSTAQHTALEEIQALC